MKIMKKTKLPVICVYILPMGSCESALMVRSPLSCKQQLTMFSLLGHHFSRQSLSHLATHDTRSACRVVFAHHESGTVDRRLAPFKTNRIWIGIEIKIGL